MNTPVYTLLERNISIQLSSEVECPISDFLGVIGTITKAEEINVCYWLYSGCVFGEDIATLFFKNKFSDMSLNGVRKIIADFKEQHPIVYGPDIKPIDCNRWDLIYNLEMIEIPTPFSDFGTFLPLSSWESLKQYLYVSSKPNITNVRKWVKDYNTTLNSSRWTSAQMQTISSSIMVQLGLSPNKFYFSEENVASIMVSEMENEVSKYLPEITEGGPRVYEIEKMPSKFHKVMEMALNICGRQLDWKSYVIHNDSDKFVLIFNEPHLYRLSDGNTIEMCESCERMCAKVMTLFPENKSNYDTIIPNIAKELRNWFDLSDKDIAEIAYDFTERHPIFRCKTLAPIPNYYINGIYTITYKNITIQIPEKEDKKLLSKLAYADSTSMWERRLRNGIKQQLKKQHLEITTKKFIKDFGDRYVYEKGLVCGDRFNFVHLIALAPFLYLGGALVWLMIGLISMAIAGVFAMIF